MGKQTPLAFALLLVVLSVLAAYGPVIAFDRLEGVIGDAIFEQRRSGADQAVAALNAMVEERQGLARFQSFHPQADLAQFDGHGVDVRAVDAMADHIAQPS